MIETDKILLAELAALLLKDGRLPFEQESELKQLLEKYPSAKDSLRHHLSNSDIPVPFDLRSTNLDEEWQNIEKRYNQKVVGLKSKEIDIRNRNSYITIGIAAAVLLIVSFFGLWQIQSKSVDYLIPDKVYGHKNDVLPGGVGAILKIEGRDEIDLMDNQVNRDLSQGIKLKDGKLVYAHNLKQNLNARHTLIVPIRSTIALTLSDGTKVWVNSESELTYKANFDEKERRIKLKGDAYFEVAKDAQRPFIVETNNANIQAIGTAFTVNSYQTTTKVSLTEGRLKVSNHENEIFMHAGSEAEIVDNKIVTLPVVNKAEATAFKNGYFYFKNKNMQQILDELSRWYGVQIECRVVLNNERYQGGIKRVVTLAEVCSVLKDLTGYKLTIDEDKLIVSK